MLTHAEIIIRTPDNDVLHASVFTMPFGMGESFDVALKIHENAIATLVFQTGNGGLKITPIHHQRHTLERFSCVNQTLQRLNLR